ncbi:DoxX family membrane protein [Tundrisphaera lichenicola]|uniref:DoxX family membrane protein n=1 Tax=Tundrisphaera lichenicola TaxID=2029860 RepID=UPI003EBF3354
MSEPSTNPYTWGPLGPDPGRGIRVLVALLLRLAIGITLLNTGLMSYLNARGAGMGLNSGINIVGFNGFDPLLTAIPYLSIGLGLALILGFLTTPTAVGAGFFTLLTPLLTTVAILASGMSGGGVPRGFSNGFGGNPFDSMALMFGMSSFLPGLIPNLVLIWLSPLENHPYSVDALIFNRAAGPSILPPHPPSEVVAGTLEEPRVPD